MDEVDEFLKGQDYTEQIREFTEYFTEKNREDDIKYDWYEFEDEEAEEMFISFCNDKSIPHDKRFYSDMTVVNVPNGMFERAVLKINKALYDNIPCPITKAFLKQIM